MERGWDLVWDEEKKRERHWLGKITLLEDENDFFGSDWLGFLKGSKIQAHLYFFSPFWNRTNRYQIWIATFHLFSELHTVLLESNIPTDLHHQQKELYCKLRCTGKGRWRRQEGSETVRTASGVRRGRWVQNSDFVGWWELTTIRWQGLLWILLMVAVGVPSPRPS